MDNAKVPPEAREAVRLQRIGQSICLDFQEEKQQAVNRFLRTLGRRPPNPCFHS